MQMCYQLHNLVICSIYNTGSKINADTTFMNLFSLEMDKNTRTVVCEAQESSNG